MDYLICWVKVFKVAFLGWLILIVIYVRVLARVFNHIPMLFFIKNQMSFGSWWQLLLEEVKFWIVDFWVWIHSFRISRLVVVLCAVTAKRLRSLYGYRIGAGKLFVFRLILVQFWIFSWSKAWPFGTHDILTLKASGNLYILVWECHTKQLKFS